MLAEISCDKFAETHRIITFRNGLNTVLGSSGGSNAIGKSTFLQIIDYAFGGEDYYVSYIKDIKKYVGEHTIHFKFELNDQSHYFYRTMDNRNEVCRCDKEGHLIEKLSIEDYRKFLFQEYSVGLPNLKLNEICDHFFRIYGRENTLERYPLQVTPRESQEKAVDFLMLLFNGNAILASLKLMEEQLGLKAAQLHMRQRQFVDTEKIEENEASIRSLQERLNELMKNNEEAQMAFFGFDPEARKKIETAQRELRSLLHRRDQIQSQINALKENISIQKQESAEEFQALLQFFPDADMKSFSEIESFHKGIRQILNSEMTQEIERLTPVIGRCEKEISRLKEKIISTGVAKNMSEQILAQCVQISKAIDRLQEQNDELIHQKELQEARTLAERQLEKLFEQQKAKLSEIETAINSAMKEINCNVTENKETEPTLSISERKEITFVTAGNTSEGTAFKSLVIYDLSILSLCPIPALIHDSNILKRIGDVNLEHILEQYKKSGKQVFIAFDKADSTTPIAHDILEDTAVLRLSDGDELFGKSWSKIDPATQA